MKSFEMRKNRVNKNWGSKIVKVPSKVSVVEILRVRKFSLHNMRLKKDKLLVLKLGAWG